MSARQTSACLELRHVWSTDPGNFITWRRFCPTFTVVNPGTNHVSAGSFGLPLPECTSVPSWWPTPDGWGRVTASFGSDCGTDCPSLGVFYDQWSYFLCRRRSGVEQPSALSDVISVLSGSPKTSWNSSIYPSRHSKTFLPTFDQHQT